MVFAWKGSLNAGQTYQVTAHLQGTDFALQSGLLTTTSWQVDIPAERFGEWRWTVSVIQGGQAVATSAEGMFWFNPHSGGGGGGGGGGKNTPAPP